jgi:chemotaxis signal transduction protein
MQVEVDYLLGIGKVDKSFVLILDIDRVLSMTELSSAAMLAAPSEEETQPNAAR